MNVSLKNLWEKNVKMIEELLVIGLTVVSIVASVIGSIIVIHGIWSSV